ncbi:glycosyltransferase family 2 protein [Deinococcus aestuarii]|uniref:glycosyltransferase family 2 protein n=1 Tax=Deinococcus aestuarii TaxID=2774531 RepID=UPI001C0ACD29|nr:glycosyltransferase family A protein [Deinococcus aestuarii]
MSPSRVARPLATLLALASGAWAPLAWRRVRAFTPLLPGDAPGEVSVIIPARDEAGNIGPCARGWLAQTHPPQEVIVVDDGSADGTAEEARGVPGARLRVLSAPPLPPGWAGKVHALHVGAQEARGEWLLFTDADMRARPPLLARALATARHHGFDLVTCSGTQARPTLAWRMLWPVGGLLVMAASAPDGRARYALGVGHFLLVRRAAFEAVGGWASLRASVGEDVDFATRLRDHGSRVAAVEGEGLLHTASLANAPELLASFRKSFYGSAIVSTPQLLTGGLWLLALGGLPPVLAALGLRRRDRALTAWALAAWGLQALGRRLFDHRLGVPAAYALTAPPAWAAYGGMLLDAGLRRVTRRPALWKGRDRPAG